MARPRGASAIARKRALELDRGRNMCTHAVASATPATATCSSQAYGLLGNGNHATNYGTLPVACPSGCLANSGYVWGSQVCAYACKFKSVCAHVCVHVCACGVSIAWRSTFANLLVAIALASHSPMTAQSVGRPSSLASFPTQQAVSLMYSGEPTQDITMPAL